MSNREHSVAAQRERPSIFSVVFIPTLACNCDCLHCFEHLGQTAPRDHDWDAVFARVRQIAEAVECNLLRIYWQGGEVMAMNPRTVHAILDAEERAFRDSGIETERHLQTNLLAYDNKRWKDALVRFGLGTVSSSIDYPNLYRRTRDLEGEAYNAAWIEKKREVEADGFEVSVISLVNRGTLELPVERFYDYYLRELSIRSFQLNLPFPGTRAGIEPLDLGKLSSFLVRLYRHWVATGREANLSPFKALEQRLTGAWAPLVCAWSFSCATSLLAIGPSGNVGQCDCWVASHGERDFGSVFTHSAEELLLSPERRPFLERGLELAWKSECGECRFWSVCHGGCPVRAFTLRGEVSQPDYYCPAYRDLFAEIYARADDIEPARRAATHFEGAHP